MVEQQPLQQPEPQPSEGVPEVLNFGDILSHAFRWGFGQYWRLLLMYLLWVVTIWIPYLNVGTTIAVSTGAPLLMSRRQRIDPTFIFDRSYRQIMGAWMVCLVLQLLGVTVAALFLVIPGIVLSIAWCLAPILLLERGVSPTEALRLSEQATHGEKWTILFGLLAVYLLYAIPALLVWWILQQILPEGAVITDVIRVLYAILAYAGLGVVDVAAAGYIYAVLAKRV